MTTIDIHGMEQRIVSMPSLDQPVVTWFVDLDGVINLIGPAPRNGWGSYAHTSVMAFEGVLWPITYSPTLVRLLNLLHAKKIVQFRYLTTWEYEGPQVFAPAVGLALGEWVAAVDEGGGTTWWKLNPIVDHLVDATELVVWTDDDIHHFLEARQVVDFLHPEKVVVVCPDSRKGLTPENFAFILAAIEKQL